jgi:hypothetical protein
VLEAAAAPTTTDDGAGLEEAARLKEDGVAVLIEVVARSEEH